MLFSRLMKRMYVVLNNATPEKLHNTWVKVEYRLDISRATNGSDVEVYGTKGKKSQFSLFVIIAFICGFVSFQKF